MKKSEITVTMPINAYDELVAIKTKYEILIKEFADCYDMNNFKINPAEPIRFDGEKAEKIMHKFLPYFCRDAKISF